jgi:hypothetical protein
MRISFGLWVAIFFVGSTFSSNQMSNAQAAAVVEPGGTADATALALSNPAEYAWQLFFFLNRQEARYRRTSR